MRLVDTILDQARRAPTRVAVESSAETLTYAELAERSAQWRDALVDAGARPGDVVVLDMPRGATAVAAMLGTARAGATYTVIRSDHPPERRNRMLASVSPVCEVDVHFLDTRPTAPPVADHRRGDDDALYVVFTSGTTSEPKAVTVPDRGVLRLAAEPRLGLTPGGRLGHVSAIEFDASVFEIWAGLAAGATLVTADPSEVVNARWMLRDFIPTLDVLWLTASLFNFLVDKDAGAFAALERVVTGGEPLSLHHVNAALRHTTVVNGYGPTENTVFTTLDVMTDPVDEICIGLPVSGTDVLVLDQDGRDTDAGELVALGRGVALGYRNRPDDTAFTTVRGKPAYRSGDFVRRHSSGRLLYEGRIDSQIKINGYRVDLREVEAAFLSIGVATCKAFMADGVLTAAVTPDVPVSRAAVDALLPVYMRPRRIVPLEAIPLTSNGKADVAALVAIGARSSAPAPAPALAQVATETVRTVASRVFGRPVPPGLDDLFEIGFDSIGVWRLVTAVNDWAGIDVPFFSVLADPSLDHLARVVAARGGPEAVRLPPAPVTGQPAPTATSDRTVHRRNET